VSECQRINTHTCLNPCTYVYMIYVCMCLRVVCVCLCVHVHPHTHINTGRATDKAGLISGPLLVNARFPLTEQSLAQCCTAVTDFVHRYCTWMAEAEAVPWVTTRILYVYCSHVREALSEFCDSEVLILQPPYEMVLKWSVLELQRSPSSPANMLTCLGGAGTIGIVKCVSRYTRKQRRSMGSTWRQQTQVKWAWWATTAWALVAEIEQMARSDEGSP